MKFFKFPFICITSSAFLLSACHTGSQTDSKTLVVGLGSAPTTLDPRVATDANSQRINDLVFSALVRNGPELKPVPQDALSWKVENHKISFKLKQGLKFQDGRPVQMEDYIYSINEFRKPSSPFGSVLAKISSVTSKDDTLILNLNGNDASLLTTLSDVKIMPRALVEEMGPAFAAKPIGAGPYKLEKLDSQEAILRKSEFTSYATPAMDTLVFKFVRDENTRYLKILKGDIDILSNELSEEKVLDLKETGKVNVILSSGLNFNYVLLNLRDEHLKNLSFRRALFAALKRDEIVKYKLENMASLATSILAPENPFSAPDLAFSKMTLSEAKKEIQKLNFGDTEFSLKTSTQAVENGQIVAQEFESLGIKVRQQSLEWGTYYSDIKAGRFQIALMRWVGIIDPDIYRDTLSSGETPPGKNRGYFSDSLFDSLVETGRGEMNFEKRRKIYLKAQQIVADDLPILPLWYNDNITVTGLRIKNFKPIVTGSFFPLLSVTKE